MGNGEWGIGTLRAWIGRIADHDAVGIARGLMRIAAGCVRGSMRIAWRVG
jgi:hypothetical protein